MSIILEPVCYSKNSVLIFQMITGAVLSAKLSCCAHIPVKAFDGIEEFYLLLKLFFHFDKSDRSKAVFFGPSAGK
jgi:hypothetical protein